MSKSTPSSRMKSCEALTGPVDPWGYARAIGRSGDIGDYLEHFGEYLKACGVRYFSALEVSTPSKSSQAVAARTGSEQSLYRGQFVLVLPVWLWQPMGACVLLADKIRKAHDAPVSMRNGIRPWWINQQVASSGISSDHPMTAAADLDLSSGGNSRAAHAEANRLYDLHAEDLDISMGLGSRVVHLGVHSPNGHRRWSY